MQTTFRFDNIFQRNISDVAEKLRYPQKSKCISILHFNLKESNPAKWKLMGNTKYEID